MKLLDLGIIFSAIILILMLSLAMSSRIETPTAGTTEYEVYTNLTSLVSMLYTTWYGVLLIVAMAAIVGAVALLGKGKRW